MDKVSRPGVKCPGCFIAPFSMWKMVLLIQRAAHYELDPNIPLVRRKPDVRSSF